MGAVTYQQRRDDEASAGVADEVVPFYQTARWDEGVVGQVEEEYGGREEGGAGACDE